MPCRILAAGLVLLILALPQSAAAAPTWLAPRNLSVSGNGSDLNVRVDAAGDAFAVWTRSGTVQAAQRPAAGAWSAPQDISGTCIAAQAVELAVSPAGKAVAVWECPKGGNTVVQATTGRRGGSWSAPHDLSAPGHDAHVPQVALDRAGNALAVWMRSNGTDVIVQAALQRATGAWLAPEAVSRPGFDVDRPDVALDARGNGVAVWQSSDGFNSIVQAATRTAAGSWSTPQPLWSGGYAERPQVGVDSAGEAVAVWSFHSANVRVEAAVRRAGGGWAPAQTLSSPGADALQPWLAVNPRGDAIAAWRSFDGRTSVIQTTSRQRGGAWSAVQDISPRSPDLGAPKIALDAAGNAVAVWRGLRSAHERIQVVRHPARGAWAAPRLISSGAAEADLPDVALDAAGNGAAIWQSGNGVSWTVQAAGLDAAGPVLRPRIAGRRIPQSRLTFSVSPFDVWSALRGSSRWSFGDGASANGRRVTHAYRRTGSFTVRVSQADAVGNASTTTRRIVIAAPCVVPAVVGKTLAAAKAAIRRSHCHTGRITRARSGTVPRGRVLSQRPAPGRRLANGAEVNLVLSRGRR
jgi:PKD domain-containing protein/PASTA domain-containing protein